MSVVSVQHAERNQSAECLVEIRCTEYSTEVCITCTRSRHIEKTRNKMYCHLGPLLPYFLSALIFSQLLYVVVPSLPCLSLASHHVIQF